MNWYTKSKSTLSQSATLMDAKKLRGKEPRSQSLSHGIIDKSDQSLPELNFPFPEQDETESGMLFIHG